MWDPSLLTLPNVDEEMASKLAARGIAVLPQLVQLATSDPVGSDW
jgi:hypothetical protein